MSACVGADMSDHVIHPVKLNVQKCFAKLVACFMSFHRDSFLLKM